MSEIVRALSRSPSFPFKERPGLAFTDRSYEFIFASEDENKPVFPLGLSLECCEGDENAERIQFTHDHHVEMRVIDDWEPTDGIQSQSVALYHSHVLWSYAHRCWRKEDGLYEFYAVSLGPHLSINERKAGIGPNEPAGLCKPEILEAAIAFVDRNGNEKLRFGVDPEWLTVSKLFTRAELDDLADGNTLITRLHLTVARSYFTLSKLLTELPTVSDKTVDMVERILRGEKPTGWDWAITVSPEEGGGDRPCTYYVHSAALSRISDKFKGVFKTGRSSDDLIRMSGQNHCAVPILTPHEMPVLLSIAYGLPTPLSEVTGRASKVGIALTDLLEWSVLLEVVFPHWERIICDQALSLDKRDLAHSLPAIYRLLIIIWSCPYGALPAAKRVAIGVFADMYYLNMPTGNVWDAVSKPECLTDELNREAGKLQMYAHTEAIFDSMFVHLHKVTAVRKVGLKQPEEIHEIAVAAQPTAAAAAVAAARDLAAPTVVPIEDDEDVAYHDYAESAAWTCAIS